jgi:acyl-CoA hydrolase
MEIDLDGQVNAETVAKTWVGGIGGQPDFAASAAISPGGLSIVAMTVQNRGKPTLVERLQGPVTTPGHDVDVVVTELGVADLRGLSRPERRAAMANVWGPDAP